VHIVLNFHVIFLKGFLLIVYVSCPELQASLRSSPEHQDGSALINRFSQCVYNQLIGLEGLVNATPRIDCAGDDFTEQDKVYLNSYGASLLPSARSKMREVWTRLDVNGNGMLDSEDFTRDDPVANAHLQNIWALVRQYCDFEETAEINEEEFFKGFIFSFLVSLSKSHSILSLI
jgi:hypothetical protein